MDGGQSKVRLETGKRKPGLYFPSFYVVRSTQCALPSRRIAFSFSFLYFILLFILYYINGFTPSCGTHTNSSPLFHSSSFHLTLFITLSYLPAYLPTTTTSATTDLSFHFFFVPLHPGFTSSYRRLRQRRVVTALSAVTMKYLLW